MGRNRRWWLAGLVVLALFAAACDGVEPTTAAPPATTVQPPVETTETPPVETTAPAETFKFGMILVGPKDDRGWSQAHFEAGQYVEEKLGNAEMIFLDLVNTADRPDQPVEQVAADMISQGARLVFATSDDMKDGIQLAAEQHPDVPMIWSSGDSAWTEGKAYRSDLPNLGNVMGRMEYGKMIAGCAAALSTQTGSIGYLGPLINDETRRLANSVYLGARNCWETFRGEDPGTLRFEVSWIGFWFHIPGVTTDPTIVANTFFDGGADVVVSGIDTTQGLVVAGQRAAAGDSVRAIPYDFRDACAEAPAICLGVPYFNWGPSYLAMAQSVIDGSFSAQFQWLGPDWSDINNRDASMIGWVNGEGLSSEAAASLELFIGGLADGSVDLFVGPLNYQDGTPWLAEGEKATDFQIWYTEQLLEGMIGQSA